MSLEDLLTRSKVQVYGYVKSSGVIRSRTRKLMLVTTGLLHVYRCEMRPDDTASKRLLVTCDTVLTVYDPCDTSKNRHMLLLHGPKDKLNVIFENAYDQGRLIKALIEEGARINDPKSKLIYEEFLSSISNTSNGDGRLPSMPERVETELKSTFKKGEKVVSGASNDEKKKRTDNLHETVVDGPVNYKENGSDDKQHCYDKIISMDALSGDAFINSLEDAEQQNKEVVYATIVPKSTRMGRLDEFEGMDNKEGDITKTDLEPRESTTNIIQDAPEQKGVHGDEVNVEGCKAIDMVIAIADKAAKSLPISENVDLRTDDNLKSESVENSCGSETNPTDPSSLKKSEKTKTRQAIETSSDESNTILVKQSCTNFQKFNSNENDENIPKNCDSEDNEELLMNRSNDLTLINHNSSSIGNLTEISSVNNASNEVNSSSNYTHVETSGAISESNSNKFLSHDLNEAINEDVRPFVEDTVTDASLPVDRLVKSDGEESPAEVEAQNPTPLQDDVSRTAFENGKTSNLEDALEFHLDTESENGSAALNSSLELAVPLGSKEPDSEDVPEELKNSDISTKINMCSAFTHVDEEQRRETLSSPNEDFLKLNELSAMPHTCFGENELDPEKSDISSGAIFIGIVEPEGQSDIESVFSDIEMINSRVVQDAAFRNGNHCEVPYFSVVDFEETKVETPELKPADKNSTLKEVISSKKFEETTADTQASGSNFKRPNGDTVSGNSISSDIWDSEGTSEKKTHKNQQILDTMEDTATESGPAKLIQDESIDAGPLLLMTSETKLSCKTDESFNDGFVDIGSLTEVQDFAAGNKEKTIDIKGSLSGKYSTDDEEEHIFETVEGKTSQSSTTCDNHTEVGRTESTTDLDILSGKGDAGNRATSVPDKNSNELLDVFARKITDAYLVDKEFLSGSQDNLLQEVTQGIVESHISSTDVDGSSEPEFIYCTDSKFSSLSDHVYDSRNRRPKTSQCSDLRDVHNSSASQIKNDSHENSQTSTELKESERSVQDKILQRKEQLENLSEAHEHDNADDFAARQGKTTEPNSSSRNSEIYNIPRVFTHTEGMNNSREENSELFLGQKSAFVEEDERNVAVEESRTEKLGAHASENRRGNVFHGYSDKPILQSALKKTLTGVTYDSDTNAPKLSFEEMMGRNMTPKTVRFDENVSEKMYDPSSDSAESAASLSENEDDPVDEYWGSEISAKLSRESGKSDQKERDQEEYNLSEIIELTKETKQLPVDLSGSNGNDGITEVEKISVDSEVIELVKETTQLPLDHSGLNDDNDFTEIKNNPIDSVPTDKERSQVPEKVPVTSVNNIRIAAHRGGLRKIPVLTKLDDGQVYVAGSSPDSNKGLCMLDLAGDDRNFYKRLFKIDEGYLIVLRAPKTSTNIKPQKYGDNRTVSSEKDVVLSKVALRGASVEPALQQSNSGLYNVKVKPPHHNQLNLQFQTRDEQMKYTFMLSDEVVRISPRYELPDVIYPSRAEKLNHSSYQSPMAGEELVTDESSASSSANKALPNGKKDFSARSELKSIMNDEVEKCVASSFRTDKNEIKLNFLKNVVSDKEFKKVRTRSEALRSSPTQIKIPDAFSTSDSQILFKYTPRKVTGEKNSPLENRPRDGFVEVTQMQLGLKPALPGPAPSSSPTRESRLASSRQTSSLRAAQTDEQTSSNRRTGSSVSAVDSIVKKQRRVSAPLLIDKFEEEYSLDSSAEKKDLSSHSKTPSKKLPFEGHVNAMKKVFENMSDDCHNFKEPGLQRKSCSIHRKFSLGSNYTSTRFETEAKRLHFESAVSAVDNREMTTQRYNNLHKARPGLVRQTSLTTDTRTNRIKEDRKGVADASLSQSQLRRRMMVAKMELAALETERTQLVDRGNAVCRQLSELDPAENDLE